MQEVEEDCTTEATTPTSFEPVGQSRMSTVELTHEEVAPSHEAFRPVDEDTSPAEDVRPPEEEAIPADVMQPEKERDSDKRDEPESDSNSSSVDELLADWQEDLEAFQQMEKDEL